MEIKIAILSIGMALLICYLVFVNRREKYTSKNLKIQQTLENSQTPLPQFDSNTSTKPPIKPNRKEFDSFLEKRKLEIFREILRRDHIAQQKRQINKATCLREILEKLLGDQGAVGIFNYYGSVELFSDTYKNYLGHIPDEVILKCFDDNQQWKPKIEIYEKIKQAILDGSLKTIEEPKESDIWIISIYPDSFEQWLQKNQENLKALLDIIEQKLPPMINIQKPITINENQANVF
jgi:hypothetical protein